jgi:hypothetical protein
VSCQTVSSALPFALLAARTLRPPAVFILARNPWTLERCLFLGWYVIFAIANTSLTGWLKQPGKFSKINAKSDQISAESDEQLNNYIRKAGGRQA